MALCKVVIGGQIRKYEQGTKYIDIANEYQKDYKNDIVLVFKDKYKLCELNNSLEEDCELEFVTTSDSIGYETYKRSLCFLFVKAVYDVCGHSSVKQVRIHFSYSHGYYCTLEGDVNVDGTFVYKVRNRMKELSDKKLLIGKESIKTSEAINRFKEYGMHDKERLFEYRRVSKVNIYNINDFEDYYYGYMVPDTSYLKYFELYQYNEGMLLQMPTLKDPTYVPPVVERPKLFNVMNDSVKWGDCQDIETVGDLNDMITHHDMTETVLVQEAYQESKIAAIAKQIAKRKGVKFVLIAGPSSSGKTTFSHRLSIQLRVNGLTPHPIAVDNYFVDRELTPRDENGDYNFECIEAININRFNEDMSRLLKGEEVYLPIFNFKTGKSTNSEKPKKLGKNDILVIEGIHCLNPKLTENLSDENKFKIYISALTQLNIDEHNRIPSTDGRLIRRIVRDARTRGTSAQQTIAMWPSVRRGEEENIFPYQEEADAMFNSSLIYECAVLKQYVEPLLFGMDKECPEYQEAKRLLKFFDYFVGIGSDAIPRNSLLREFIGGGCFNV